MLLATADPAPLSVNASPVPSPGETPTAPAYDTYHPDPAKTQLIACVANEETGKPVTTCSYLGGYVRYHRQGHYKITVYEPRTGRKLGTTKVLGETQYTCMAQVSFFQGEPKSKMLWLDPSLLAYRKALAPWVNAVKS
ncbi:hypothetical protein [Streptomyces sp. NPDC021562]|uniref:hypothetical protein n=1 Tax=Streptomyces sp. NPDC021562 TaxID=3155121 RepID=UPI00104BE61C